MNFLYTIIVLPLIQIMELCYLFVYRLSHNPGISLFGVSIAVSIFTLPLYFRAESLQKAEREIQKRMAPKIAKIKAAFTGDEQYMILSTYYRQNHYHPIYAMRNTFSLFIQIPFFIAAYSYLSHLEVLRGSSFLFIRDLGIPDALFFLGKGIVTVNILPIAMTAINCVSGVIYTNGLPLKDKIQLYGMALIFLVLLYNSPSGLVLYWTMNNIFSLAKNILAKTKYAKRWIYGILFTGTAFLDIYVLFFHSGYLPKRLLICAIFSIIFLAPLLKKISTHISYKFKNAIPGTAPSRRCFSLALLVFTLLTGTVVPISLIASSVAEFSFIEPYGSPFFFILHTLLQAAGIFLFWPICIYLLFSQKPRQIFSVGMIVLSFGALLNVFLVNENFGFLTNTLIFSEPKPFAAGDTKAYFANLIILIISTGVVLCLILKKRNILLFTFQTIVLVSLFCLGIVNIIRIHGDYVAFQIWQGQGKDNSDVEITGYTLSKTGNNVLLIMLDAAVASYVPYIFEERPELIISFQDFTWYPNCVSFASHTLVGAPPLYGGYEYTPDEINRRDSAPLMEKHKEAYLLLPRLFSELNYSVTVTDPPFDNFRMSNLDIFAGYPKIHAENIIGKYTPYWLNIHPDIQGQTIDIADLLHNNLIRFSIFKLMPLLLRSFIYDDGHWLTTAHYNTTNTPKNGLTNTFLNDYALLDLLPQLTGIIDAGNTYTAIYAPLPHEPALLQAPDYIPSTNISVEQNDMFANDNRYHVNIASFLLLEKYFCFLKDAGIYDNTRIILVSDHGFAYRDTKNEVLLPNGSNLQSFHPLLMVKDFRTENEYSKDRFMIDSSFMTNADTVFFALKDIIENPVNPFTAKPLQVYKDNGVNVVTIGALSSYRHTKYKYNIGKNQWLHVHDNIFDLSNWKVVEK
jgi:YidC/Oxa1 family membrane protein insertase